MLVATTCAAASFLLATFLAGRIRRYAIDHAILDIPNQRSSHTEPTPRGGGLAIALTAVLGMLLVDASPLGSDSASVLAIAAGGSLVAAIGWFDDVRGVTPLVRIAVHLIAAVVAVYGMGGFDRVQLGTSTVDLAFAGPVVAILAIVWSTNLFNFMDGIDGLAAAEAISVSTAGGILLLATGSMELGIISLIVAGAAAGFMLWNWPPARLFMGDAGSGFLGFALGCLAVESEKATRVQALVWMVLMGVFITDATVTLVRRMMRGEALYKAHRSHAYQRLVAAGWTHRRVTSTVAAFNIWLAIVCALIVAYPTWTLSLVIGAVCFLTAAYFAVERSAPMHSR